MDTFYEIEASYQVTYSERLRATWNLTLRSPLALLTLSILPAMGVLLLWTMSWPTSNNNALDYVFVIACFAYMPLMLILSAYRSYRADQRKGPYHYRFNGEGVHVSTATSELTQRWPAILRVREANGILFLYFTKRCAHIVPLRVLTSPAESRAIQQLAAAGGVTDVGT
jgi:hypothetical protein